uniref:LisH domain-containing protein n=1 Tax=Globodera pallida TaxID=36090 RepID=A0A183C703_GLOPA
MSSESKMSAIAEPLRLITSPPISSKSKLTAPITSSALTSTPPAGILTHPDFANSYQLDIISALRGNEHNFLARAAIADAIRVLQSDEDKLKLIDFLASKEQGAIALTLENNACKMFNCTPSELSLVSNHQQTKQHFLSKLSELFNISLHKSIPTVFAMLFPLQRELFEEDPNLQRALGQMFGLIHLEFAGEMGESESFNRIYANFLGESNESAGASNEGEASETVKMGRKVGMAAIGERKPADLMRQATTTETKFARKGQQGLDHIGRKVRAKTMPPSKSVTFWDDQF